MRLHNSDFTHDIQTRELSFVKRGNKWMKTDIYTSIVKYIFELYC